LAVREKIRLPVNELIFVSTDFNTIATEEVDQLPKILVNLTGEPE